MKNTFYSSEGKRNEYLLEAAFRRFFLPYFRYYCTSLLQKSNKNTLNFSKNLLGWARKSTKKQAKHTRLKTMAQNSSFFPSFSLSLLFCRNALCVLCRAQRPPGRLRAPAERDKDGQTQAAVAERDPPEK